MDGPIEEIGMLLDGKDVTDNIAGTWRSSGLSNALTMALKPAR